MTIATSSLAKRLFTLCLCLCLSIPLGASDWPTFAHDPQRTGWLPGVAVLTVENAHRLELLWKAHVKNKPHSLTALTAPVVASGVATSSGIKALVYVAGSDNHFFALDADSGKVVWERTFESDDVPKNPYFWLCPEGINATPTIDKSRDLIYTLSADGRLYGLDLATGDIKFGPVQFVPAFSKNWSLNLFGGIVYTTVSQNCSGAWSGIYSMDTRRVTHPVIRDLLLGGVHGAGVWGRGGSAIGENGEIYVSTGDGKFDPAKGDFASSVVGASLDDLQVRGYFTPANQAYLTKYDLDLGSASPVWLSYKGYNLVAAGGKEGVVYLLNAGNLGGKDHHTPLFITPQLANQGQSFDSKGVFGALSAWKDHEGATWIAVPIWGPKSKRAPKFPLTNGPAPHGSIMVFKVVLDSAGGKPILQPAWISGDFNLPDPVAIENGVLFALSTGENANATMQGGVMRKGLTQLTTAQKEQGTSHAVLYALDAKTGDVLYSSGNAISDWVHFSGLALADGRIYAVDHNSNVYCFGLPPAR